MEKEIQNLLTTFPECERIKRSDVEPVLVDAFKNSRSYRDVGNKLFDFCFEKWPSNFDDDEETKSWADWFFNISTGLDNWVSMVKKTFVEENGRVRSHEEACKLAADKWTQLISDSIKQDNGDKTGHSDMLMLLGMYSKASRQDELTNEIREKFRENMTEFYLNDCEWQYVDGRGNKSTINHEPSCDYNANGPLHDIMLNSGIPESSIDLLAPWKTLITIDKKDGSVGYHTYAHTEWL